MGRGVRGRGGRTVGGAVLALIAPALAPVLAPGVAHAAERPHVFDIPVQAREDALLALSAQAGVTLGFAQNVRCPGRVGLHGRMTTDAALRLLLAGSGCASVRVDPGALMIIARPALAPPPSPARAAPRPAPSPDRPVDLGEVIVTATKRETRLGEAPYSLSVVPGEMLAREGVVDTPGLPTLAAGVTVTNLGPGRNKILLRGLSDGPLTGHTQSTVGIYVDELRLTYNAPDPDLRWTDVARVEVLRGPQGSLYGAGSIGGIVQVVANAPDPTARSGWFGVTGEATARGEPSAALEGAFNQPLAGGRGAVRLAGWSEVAGGYIDNVRTGRNDVDRTTRRGGRASLLWAPGGPLTLEGSLISQSINSRDAHYAQPSVGPLARAAAYPEPHDNDFLAANLTARWQAPAAELTVTAGVIDHTVSTRYDASGAPAELVLPGAGPATYHDESEIRGWLGEARLVSRRPGRLQWLAGVFTSAGAQRLEADLTDTAGRPGYAELRHDDLLESALFGEASYALTGRLTLTAGGRLFASELRTRSETTLGPAGAPFSGRTRDGGFAPKLVLGWRLSRGATLYAQAAEGYRTSGFNTAGAQGQAFGLGQGAEQPLRRYRGDELWSYEAGVRWASADGAAQLRAALFHSVWRHIQADLLLPSGLPFTANLGEGQSKGLELEGSRQIAALTLSGALTLQEPELQRLDPGFAERRDAGLPGVPKLAFSLMAAYERPLDARWTLELASRYAYVGRSRLTFSADVAPVMGDYGDLRLSAAIRSDRLRIAAYVDNVADTRGDTFAYGNPFTLRATPQATPQRPRTFGLSLRRGF